MIVFVSSSEPSRAAAIAAIFEHLSLGVRPKKLFVCELNFFDGTNFFRSIKRDEVSLYILTLPSSLAKFMALVLIRSGFLSFLRVKVFLPTPYWSRWTGVRAKKNFLYYGDGFGYANAYSKPSWLTVTAPTPRRNEKIFFISSTRSHESELIKNGCAMQRLDFIKATSILNEISYSKKQMNLYAKIVKNIDIEKRILVFCGTTFAVTNRMTGENEVALYKVMIERIRILSKIHAQNVLVLLHPGNQVVTELATDLMPDYQVINGRDPIYIETLLNYLKSELSFPSEQCIVCPGSMGPLLGALNFLGSSNIVIPFSEDLLVAHAFNPDYLKSRLKQENDMIAELTKCQ
ncbi:hypothetical protein SPH72_09655 [Rhodobacterales bacterium FZCC0083]|nr:hypothetical protein SPH72_09655 [Rhodobacterales bacterium FZCC0083]